MLAISLPLEYILGVIITLDTFPVVSIDESMKVGFVNLSFAYLLFLALSLPIFLRSFVLIWLKRERVIYDLSVGRQQMARDFANDESSEVDSEPSGQIKAD